jgi:hypothetical protein
MRSSSHPVNRHRDGPLHDRASFFAVPSAPARTGTARCAASPRAAIKDGLSLTRAAAEAGFADQSHTTRQFKNVHGLSPGRWAALARIAPAN